MIKTYNGLKTCWHMRPHSVNTTWAKWGQNRSTVSWPLKVFLFFDHPAEPHDDELLLCWSAGKTQANKPHQTFQHKNGRGIERTLHGEIAQKGVILVVSKQWMQTGNFSCREDKERKENSKIMILNDFSVKSLQQITQLLPRPDTCFW